MRNLALALLLAGSQAHGQSADTQAKLTAFDAAIFEGGISCSAYTYALIEARAERGLFTSRTLEKQMAFEIRATNTYLWQPRDPAELETAIRGLLDDMRPITQAWADHQLAGTDRSPESDAAGQAAAQAAQGCSKQLDAVFERTAWLHENGISID